MSNIPEAVRYLCHQGIRRSPIKELWEIDLPQPSMWRHASEMSEDLEKRMLAVIVGALAAMNYRQPSLNAGKRDVACKAASMASEALVAALQADGWEVVPPVGWSDAVALDPLPQNALVFG
jgi:hypothetical protein